MNEPFRPRRPDAELDELLGAYALDALEDDERVAVEEYIKQSPRARAEVDSYLQVAAALGNATGDASTHVWGAILHRLTTEREATTMDETSSQPRPLVDAARPDAARADTTATERLRAYDPPVRTAPDLARQHKRRSAGRMVFGVTGWFSAAAAVVGLVVVQQQSNGRDDLLAQRSKEVSSLNERLELQTARLNATEPRLEELQRRLGTEAAELAKARNAERVLGSELNSFREGVLARAEFLLTDATVERTTLSDATGASVATVLLTKLGEGYIVASNLPDLPVGKTYQLWAVSGDKVLSVGVLGSTVRAAPFSAAPTEGGATPAADTFRKFVLTVETGTGVIQSEGPAVATGALA